MAEEKFHKFLIFIFSLFGAIFSILAQDVNGGTSNCLYNINEEKYIDLSNIINSSGNPYLKAYANNNLTFYFSGCSHFNLTSDNSCNNTTFCISDAFNKNNSYFGDSEGVFKDKNGITYFFLSVKNNYKHGDKNVSIELVCTNIKESYLHFVKNEKNSYDLALFSPHSCVLINHRGLSTGTILLILVSSALAIYFIVGALVLRFLRGAHGKELIPNYEFWTGLPLLVRDGLLFLLSGCQSRSVQTAETYDRI